MEETTLWTNEDVLQYELLRAREEVKLWREWATNIVRANPERFECRPEDFQEEFLRWAQSFAKHLLQHTEV